MHEVKVNARGQITIPKEIRERTNIKEDDRLSVIIDQEGRVILSKIELLSELDELLKNDLIKEGYSQYEVARRLPEKRRALARSLLELADEAEKEITEGNYVTLSDLEEELNKKD